MAVTKCDADPHLLVIHLTRTPTSHFRSPPGSLALLESTLMAPDLDERPIADGICVAPSTLSADAPPSVNGYADSLPNRQCPSLAVE